MTIFGAGHQVVTSTTRPASPLIGQIIYQSDTDEYLEYVSYAGANRWMQASPKSNRNKIINGGLDVWQRGTTLSGAGYIADRFFHDNATTVDRQTDVPANAGFLYSVRHLNTIQVFPIIRQRIEGSTATSMASKNLTISFWAKSGTTTIGTGRMYVNFNYPTVLDNYTTKTNITNNFDTDAWTPDATWRFYSFSFLAPAQVVNGLEVEIVRHNSATTTFVTGVQVEIGTAPSEFEFESFGSTLFKCQRYFCKTFSYAVAPASNAGQAGSLLFAKASTTAAGGAYAQTWRFPVEMRAAPSPVTTYSPSAAGANFFDEAGGAVSAAVGQIGTGGVFIYNNGAAVIGRNAVIHATAQSEL